MRNLNVFEPFHGQASQERAVFTSKMDIHSEFNFTAVNDK